MDHSVYGFYDRTYFSLAEVADFWHGLLLYEEYLQSSRSQKEFQR